MLEKDGADTPKENDFSQKSADFIFKLGAPYRWMVSYSSQRLKPFLDRIVDDYIHDAIKRNHAENNPELKKLLTDGISARPDAHGRILDVIDTIPRTIIRSAAAVVLAITGNVIDGKVHNRDSKIFKWVGFGAALSLVMNQAVELFRSVFRYMAGFQGSETAALAKYKKLHSHDTLSSTKEENAPVMEQSLSTKSFAINIPNRIIAPENIAAQKEKSNHNQEKL